MNTNSIKHLARFIPILLVMAVFMQGCAVRKGDALNITSYDGVSLNHPQAASDLAAKAAYTMAERYPVSTPLLLVKAPSGSFNADFELALRNQGFALEADSTAPKEAIRLGFTLDMIKDDGKVSCYLQVRLSDGGTFGQSYEITPDASAPVVPTAAMTGSEPFYSHIPASEGAAPGMLYLSTASAEEWRVTPGNLKPQLEEWSKKAGYQLVWKAEHDFNMQSHAVFRDSFIGAIKRVFTRMHLNGNALRAAIYDENRVVEVLED